jgi:GNAT superfamily N-acetyltransferase
MSHVVRDARADEFGAIMQCLARAFADDPVSLFLFPDAAQRERKLPRFYRFAAEVNASHGRVLTTDSLEGGAIWRAPNPPRATRFERLSLMVRFLLQMSGAAARGREFFEATERAHPREPHWYLGVLGTEPARQGTGIGSALMRPILERCDDERLPAYLESSKESNIAFYRGHGFEVREPIEVAGAPTIWPMWREPRA